LLLASKPERRVCVKFCIKFGQSETLAVIEMAYFFDEAMGRFKTFKRHKLCLDDREITGNESSDPVDSQPLKILKWCLNIVKNSDRIDKRQ